MYTLTSTTGALVANTTASVATAFTGQNSVVVDPTGRYLYIQNFANGNLSYYSLDPASGLLTSVGNISSGAGPRDIAVY